MTTARQTGKDEAIARLLDEPAALRPGDKVQTILRHVSRSGMLRVIQLVVLRVDDRGEIRQYHIGYNAALAMDDKYDRDREGIRVSGCGMDMGFATVYNLASTLWPDGFDCIGERCPSNDHGNGQPTPHDFPARAYLREIHDEGDVDPNGPCPVYGCGLSAAAHPTQPEHHRAGGYALRQEWM